MSTDLLALLSGLQNTWEDSLGVSSPLSLQIKQTDALNSDRSVADTLGLMATYASTASRGAEIQRAIKQAGITPTMSGENCLQKIFAYIKGKVQFVEDSDQLKRMFAVPEDKELLIRPEVLLSMGKPRGDCDDFSMLAASMMIACGLPCSFVTVAADGRQPNNFTHVYCESNGVPFDASHGKYLGWETERRWRREVWPVYGGEMIKRTGPPIGPAKTHVHEVLSGLFGLGDCSFDSDTGETTCVDNLPTITPSVNPISAGTVTPSTSTNIFDSLLPGIFGSAEKIAIQTTQQPGYQTTAPNGATTSYVLPQGATSFPNIGIPGLSTASMGSFLPILLIGGGILLVMKLAEG